MGEKTRYIMSQGELKRKDDSLSFRKNGKNHYIPIEGVNEIYLLNEVSINTKLLDFLSRNGVVVHFFNYYGSYSGTFYPKDKYISGKLTLKQAKACMEFDNRLRIAKAVVEGIRVNIFEILYQFYKNGNKEVKPVTDYLKENVPNQILKSNNIQELMSVEGGIWSRFYNSFKYILNEEFEFDKRTKRPPDNPINAMISFGNSILYTKVITQLYFTHLNQGISFLHEPSESRFSLSLDLSEAFKPIIVYRSIFYLANKKMIKLKKHFDSNLKYCYLNDDGRKIFIEEIERRLNSTFKHPTLNRKVSYLNAIKLDGYKLVKDVLERKDFAAFSLSELK